MTLPGFTAQKSLGSSFGNNYTKRNGFAGSEAGFVIPQSKGKGWLSPFNDISVVLIMRGTNIWGRGRGRGGDDSPPSPPKNLKIKS